MKAFSQSLFDVSIIDPFHAFHLLQLRGDVFRKRTIQVLFGQNILGEDGACIR